MKEQFEKLPEIAEILEDNIWYFCEKMNQYFCDNLGVEDCLNLAWYAYQEPQRKISTVLRFLGGYDSIDIDTSVNLRDCVNEVQELLK